MFGSRFCERHTGTATVCQNYRECTIRCLWKTIQYFLDELLGKTTVRDLLEDEDQLLAKLDHRTKEIFDPTPMALQSESTQQYLA